MDEREVRGIFETVCREFLNDSEDWTISSVNKILLLTFRQLGETALEEAAGESIRSLAPEARTMLFEMNTARSRLRSFLPLDKDGELDMDEGRFAGLALLYSDWRNTQEYCYKHYGSLPKQSKEARTKQEFMEAAEAIAEHMDFLTAEFNAKGTVNLPAVIFQTMDKAFTLIIRLILGKDVFEKFLLDFNQALPVLQSYQTKMLVGLQTRSKRNNTVN